MKKEYIFSFAVNNSLRLSMCPGDGTKSFMIFPVSSNYDKCFAGLDSDELLSSISIYLISSNIYPGEI